MKKKNMSQLRPLTEIALDSPVTVVKIKLPADESERLFQLGLMRGSSVKVLHCAFNEPLLLAVGDSRIGVNYQLAERIYVY